MSEATVCGVQLQWCLHAPPDLYSVVLPSTLGTHCAHPGVGAHNVSRHKRTHQTHADAHITSAPRETETRAPPGEEQGDPRRLHTAHSLAHPAVCARRHIVQAKTPTASLTNNTRCQLFTLLATHVRIQGWAPTSSRSKRMSGSGCRMWFSRSTHSGDLRASQKEGGNRS